MYKPKLHIGDIWEYTTNNGTISREIKSVNGSYVYYNNNGSVRRCQRATFDRWARGAELVYSAHWDDK